MLATTIKDASNHLNRTVEERNEKHRKVLFLPFGYKPLLSKFGKYSATDLIKAFMNKPIDNFRSWSILGFLSELLPIVERVAYREAIKYGSNLEIALKRFVCFFCFRMYFFHKYDEERI